MYVDELKKYIKSDQFSHKIMELYVLDIDKDVENVKKRYLDTLDKAVSSFSDGDYHIISSPGRAEICGNHTDHQNGFVVATALDVDNICFVKKREDSIVSYKDDLFVLEDVDISTLSKMDSEVNRSESIIRGVAKRLTELGYKIGGFSAFASSNVLVGSSMSSSACFEVMIVEIFNFLYNDGKISAVDRAKIARWAENNYFGKPCGLMDQMAISVGNFVGIDFSDKENPKIHTHEFSFGDFSYNFYIINTKGNHADLTNEYAAIPGEMKTVARYFGKDVLSEVSEKDFYDNIKDIRENVKNDRAVLRAYHFFSENERAKKYDAALEKKDIDTLIDIMNASGDSSYMFLQNVYPVSDIANQGISIALSICKKLLPQKSAFRVQGGGFAGTIQVVAKKAEAKACLDALKRIFGDDSALEVKIRKYGTHTIL